MNKILIIFKKISYHFFKIAWQIKCLYVKDDLETFRLVEGSKFKYPFKSTIGRLLFSKNFEKEEVNFVLSTLKPGDIFLDVGANGGFFSILAAKKVGNQGHVYAFEPGSQELDILKQNIKLNNLNNVTVIESAVSNQSGETNFALSQDGAMNSIFKTNHPLQDIREWTKVPVITLDDFISNHKIERVNFLKIDVEGAEKLVLEGANSLISSSSPPTIMFESSDANFSSELGYKAKDVLNQLFDRGFNIEAIVPHLGLVKLESSSKIPSYNFVATKSNTSSVNIQNAN